MTKQSQAQPAERLGLAEYVEPPARWCPVCTDYTPHSVSFPGGGVRVLVCHACGRVTTGGAPCSG